MRWYDPSLSDMPWAQQMLADRDRLLNKVHAERARGVFIFYYGPGGARDILEYWLVKYVESGNTAWLKLAKDHYERRTEVQRAEILVQSMGELR